MDLPTRVIELLLSLSTLAAFGSLWFQLPGLVGCAAVLAPLRHGVPIDRDARAGPKASFPRARPPPCTANAA
jgi:hypothetical protein